MLSLYLMSENQSIKSEHIQDVQEQEQVVQELDVQELDDQELDEEEEIDPELMKKLLSISNNDLNEMLVKSPKNKKLKTKTKTKNTLSLDDFNKKIDESIIANKPKKFVSKRADEKRKILGVDDEPIVKRVFNPRKPPYNFVYKKSHNIITDMFDDSEFPTL